MSLIQQCLDYWDLETPVKVGIIILTFTGVLFIINVVILLTFSRS